MGSEAQTSRRLVLLDSLVSSKYIHSLAQAPEHASRAVSGGGWLPHPNLTTKCGCWGGNTEAHLLDLVLHGEQQENICGTENRESCE